MDSSSNEMSEEISHCNQAVPMASQTSATQIFLIKEELPNNQINSNQGAPPGYQAPQDHQRFVRIASHVSTNNLSSNRKDVKTRITSNELAQNSSGTTNMVSGDTDDPILGAKKPRTPVKKKELKSGHGPYICDKCKKSFLNEASLKAHVRRTYCQESKSLVSSQYGSFKVSQIILFFLSLS